MAEHTPGPWEVGPGHEVYSVPRYQSVAMVLGNGHGDANARLIAAAPDLLAALYEAREFIDGQIDVVDGSYGEPAPNRAMVLAQEIDAAIAKATGSPVSLSLDGALAGAADCKMGVVMNRKDDPLLMDCLYLLHSFALEQTGWRGFFRRWYYSDEPLRHDAANLVRRAEFMAKQPEYTRLVGEGR